MKKQQHGFGISSKSVNTTTKEIERINEEVKRVIYSIQGKTLL